MLFYTEQQLLILDKTATTEVGVLTYLQDSSRNQQTLLTEKCSKLLITSTAGCSAPQNKGTSGLYADILLKSSIVKNRFPNILASKKKKPTAETFVMS